MNWRNNLNKIMHIYSTYNDNLENANVLLLRVIFCCLNIDYFKNNIIKDSLLY